MRDDPERTSQASAREASPCARGMAAEPAAIRGSTVPWGPAATLAIAALVVAAIALRLHGLSAEGFTDDEVHKWLAAQRYLRGIFGGDELEHPMLMKWLIAACIAVLPSSWAPETLTRLPNVFASGAAIVAVALLGRRLFGRAAGLIAAALLALSPTYAGYNRLAKEDTLCGLFLLLLLWCLAEAYAASGDQRDQARRRWETAGAVSLGLMLASKYFFFLAFIPPLAYAALRRDGAVWRVPAWRWAMLAGIAIAVLLPLDFVLLRPSSWTYLAGYLRGDAIDDRMKSESLFFMGKRYANFAFQYRRGPPLWFWPTFAAVKLAPPTFIMATVGFAVALARRRPAHRIVLVWTGVWFLSFALISVAYARYFVTVYPALLLLAAHAVRVGASWIANAARTGPQRVVGIASREPLVLVLLSALLVVTEAAASIAVSPHFKLYVSPVGGGEHNVAWFFPLCDYSDAGAREAVRFIAERAEKGAEITSEVVWPVRLYADMAGRADLVATHSSRRHACQQGRVCYVMVQEGRVFWHNQAAIEHLALRAPWHVERIRQVDVVKVYRLEPGDELFPRELP